MGSGFHQELHDNTGLRQSDSLHTAGSRPGNILFLEPSRGPPKVPAIFCYGAEAAWIAAVHGFPQDSFTYQLLERSPLPKRGRYKESVVQISVSIEILPRARWKKMGTIQRALSDLALKPQHLVTNLC